MKVREARRTDSRRIAEVSVRSWQEGYRDLMPAEYLASLSVEQREARWLEVHADPGRDLVVVEDGETIWGFAVIGASRDADAPPGVGELRSLYVDPAAWHRGCGRALWTEQHARLRARGYREATLWVLAGNARAQRFYESLGFAPDAGAIQEFEGPTFRLQEVRYRRAL
jgi:ribosomal protein S18 acetylase RimI-like enzyme